MEGMSILIQLHSLRGHGKSEFVRRIAMTGFWVFMFIMCLLTPVMMIGFGKYFMKGGPKQINWGVWISDEKIHEKSGDLDVCASV